LRSRKIPHVIPEPRDQQANRARRGSRGGRPVGFDLNDYKHRNTVERCFNRLLQWRGILLAPTSTPTTIAAAYSWRQ
jgi:transposase